MEFLVTLRQDWAALRDRADLADLVRREREAGRELMSDGTVVRIWRLPGQRANIGIWRAPDATTLTARLDGLPLRPWLDAEVVALAVHELEAIDGGTGRW
jgi:muconolactone D-isomerase